MFQKIIPVRDLVITRRPTARGFAMHCVRGSTDGETVGSGPITADLSTRSKTPDVADCDRANPDENHPSEATFFKQFAKSRRQA